jgi:UDP-glucose 4-epimerase
MNRVCITGGAGFIGSNLADRLVGAGVEVVVVDNFCTGRREHIAQLAGNPLFRLVEGDVLDADLLERAFEGCDWIVHLQANADVRFGLEHPTVDLEQNTITASRVLEAMRANGVRQILFSSTGSVYGEPEVFPTPENAPFPTQTSLYGASKLAGEGLISAYVAGYGFTGVICRFVSILGERYTHGHVLDFYKSLQTDPSRLVVLGDGHQEKSYLYVGDCVSAMTVAMKEHEGENGTFIYNLGTNETIVVDQSVEVITGCLGVTPEIVHTGGQRGWIGDSPLIKLDTARIQSLGWAPTLTIRQAIAKTVEWFATSEAAGLMEGDRA